MIDFEISRENLSKAAGQMTKARTSVGGEFVDLTCYRDNVQFVVTGREFTCPATVELKGMARFPLELLPKLRKLAGTFGARPARIRIENGRIKVNSTSITLESIATRNMSDRPIDIPDDAPVRDILALRFLFSSEEIAESDLTSRFLAANSERLKRVQSAAESLSAFGIVPSTIEALVTGALRAHAETLRPMLCPDPLSRRRN